MGSDVSSGLNTNQTIKIIFAGKNLHLQALNGNDLKWLNIKGENLLKFKVEPRFCVESQFVHRR